jgi:large subunit ribosomal protein L18
MSVTIGRNTSARLKARVARHRRIRKKIYGTQERPRLGVFRSLKDIYAQIIDDSAGTTLVSASTLSKEFKERKKKAGDKKEAASIIGELIAEKALAKDIRKVVFDRGGYALQGRVKALAQGARNKGLEF